MSRTFALLALAGCAGSANGSIPSDANTSAPDAGLSTCATLDPPPPHIVAPDSVVLSLTFSQVTSEDSAQWTVTGPAGESIPVTNEDPLGTRIHFLAADAGTYQIFAYPSVGGVQCQTISDPINVFAPTAKTEQIELRYVPLPAQDVPPQVDPSPVTIFGGAASQALGTRTLQAGLPVAGTISGPSGPISAYLRFTDERSGYVGEAIAAADGTYAAALPPGLFDVLVVPYDLTLPPATFLALAPSAIGDLALDAGTPIAGIVVDASLAPVAGATVEIGAGGLPPVVATTAIDGTFTAAVRAGTVSIAVTVPGGAGVSVTGLPAGASYTVALPGGTSSALAATAPPDATVTLVATDLSTAGSVSVDGAAGIQAPAAARIVLTADGAGALPPVTLPDGTYSAIVEPADLASGPSVTTIQTGGAPIALTAGAFADLTVTASAAAGPVSGARVVAVARGLAGAGQGMTAVAVADVSGVATLQALPGMTYDVTISGPSSAHLAPVRAVADGTMSPIAATLPPGVTVTGTLAFPGQPGGQPGVGVEARCFGCGDPTPIGVTATIGAGDFTLVVADPGT